MSRLEKKDFLDMGRPPTGHHPGEGSDATHAPNHMQRELNPTADGSEVLNKGQERRVGERRRGWRSEKVV